MKISEDEDSKNINVTKLKQAHQNRNPNFKISRKK